MKKIYTRILILIVALMTLAPATVSAAFVNPVPTNEPSPVVVNKAVEDFKSLSKKEKKERIKAAKEEIKKFKAAKEAGQDPSTNTVLLVILAILLPPLAVYLHQGEINGKFWLNLILTLLFWIPGIIHALIVVLGS